MNQSIINLSSFEVQGHRGARGLKPENTIPSFLEALKYDVQTLELDVVISADSQIVLSHEPWFSHEICTKPDGSLISKKEEKLLSIYQMSYNEIKKYDCGKNGNKHFPKQQPESVFKPTLAMVVNAVNIYLNENDLDKINYNIETKTTPKGDGVYHPDPTTFVNLLYNELKELKILKYTTIQSFDVRTLQVLHDIDSTVSTALLVDKSQTNFELNLASLGFTPDVYSCNHELVTADLIQKCHSKNMKVIPWTVNEKADMKVLIELGVYGLITDYPNRAKEVLNAFEQNHQTNLLVQKKE